jgi:hypothetical protein
VKLDDTVQLPGAGVALLALHRSLRREGITDRTAFDLLDYIGRVPPMSTQVAEVLALLGKDGPEAHAATRVLDVMVKLERLESLAKSLGVALEIPEHLAREFEQVQRKMRGDGATGGDA